MSLRLHEARRGSAAQSLKRQTLHKTSRYVRLEEKTREKANERNKQAVFITFGAMNGETTTPAISADSFLKPEICAH